MQKNKRRFCVPRKQKKIEDGFQASSFLSSAAVHFYDPINRALNDWQVFFGTEFQLVTGSLALLTFREQHFGIEIPFYRKPAGLDKLDCDREAGDSLFILNFGEIPLFNIYYFRQRLFIYTFNMGVAGAAIATAISQMVSTLVYLTYVFRKQSAFTFSIKLYAPSRKMMAEILKIGIPTLAFQLLTSLSIALINRSANGYGDAVIAGMGAVTRITSMGTLVVFGFLKGFQPIAGFSYGAKKFNRLREAIKTSIVWSTAFCLVVGLLMAIFSTQIISQFTDGNAEMIAVGQKSLMASGFSFILFGFYTVYSSLFLALGKGTAGFFLGVCRQGICFIPTILLLPVVWGLNGILYAQPIADIMTAVITVFMALRLHKELSMAERNAIPERNKK